MHAKYPMHAILGQSGAMRISNPELTITMSNFKPLAPSALRWRFDAASLDFESTSEVNPAEGIVGQPVAMEAMRFGVESSAPGQNIYVRGTSGTGRMTLVQSILQELNPQARHRFDRCYVHNFERPDRPMLLTLPAGMGPVLRQRLKEVAEFIETGLLESLSSEPMKSRRQAIRNNTQNEINQITQPLEQDLKANDLALVNLPSGQVSRTAIFPLFDGKPTPPEEISQLVQSGKVSEEQRNKIEARIKQFSSSIQETSQSASKVMKAGLQALQAFNEKEARSILGEMVEDLDSAMADEAISRFLSEVIDDVIENRLNRPAASTGGAVPPPAQLVYGVNVVCSQTSRSSPIITENSPTVANLLGTVEPEILANGQVVSNYRGVRAGTLVLADGGYLVLDAHDVLGEPGAWRLLMRALRTGSVEIVPAELGWPMTTQSIKPEPIEISVRIILIGSSRLHYQLDQADQDFSNLFKVLADFNSEISRSAESVGQYAGVVARMCRDEDLLHFDADAVCALAEHGARIASRKGKITARFGRIADIVREAAFLATTQDVKRVGREQVEETVRRTTFRASLPSSRFQELISDGTIMIQTSGQVISQINGLAVINAGPLSYGFPARITATISAGRAGIINIEGAASMSGAIHTKGFQILGGLLRHMLKANHPLAFSASIAFEQSYGGIDGDSASGAEICCLLSALTAVPIKQGIAMTGAIDQHGHIQAIGGVNEKVEGFFDACDSMGLNGEQGVIIPHSNAGDLMLRPDVVAACEDGRFRVFAVGHVTEALEVLTGMPAGEPDDNGDFTAGSLLDLAKSRAKEYWLMSFSRPGQSRGKQSGDD